MSDKQLNGVFYSIMMDECPKCGRLTVSHLKLVKGKLVTVDCSEIQPRPQE